MSQRWSQCDICKHNSESGCAENKPTWPVAAGCSGYVYLQKDMTPERKYSGELVMMSAVDEKKMVKYAFFNEL